MVNFMMPGAGMVELGCGHMGDIVKMLNFIKIFYSVIGQFNWIMMSKEFADP